MCIRDSPYLGFLACADNIVVTGDSVSMCSEATATGKTLRIFTGSDLLTPKHLRFVQSLCSKGYAADIANEDYTRQQPPASPLNTAQEIAAVIATL